MAAERADVRGPDAQRIAAGGLSALFADATDAIGVVEPDLTLNGLRRIYELNGGVWESAV